MASSNITHQEADYIVVGGGTAGCLLASRLSDNPRNGVILLEAGPQDRDPLISIPLLATINYFRAGLNWRYETEPQGAMAGRRITLPAGKVLGGTSSINGMMYMRGHRLDYDAWAQPLGMEDWCYKSVLPYFRRFERNISRPTDQIYHGHTGEVTVTSAKGENSLYDIWLRACSEAGYARNTDFNGAQQEGFGFYDFTIKRGRRVSAASAFLDPIKRRENLRIITSAHAKRLLFEGCKCVGVEYEQHGKCHQARSAKELAVCAGVYNSPQLLLLSGIGNARHLRSLNIPVVADRPEVGEHFQDHVGLMLEWRCLQPVTLYKLFRPDQVLLALLKAKLFGTGQGAIIPLEAGGIISSQPTTDAMPNLQITFVPGLSLATTRAGQRAHGFLVSVVLLRPKSEGAVTIRSADPFDKPVIQPNLLAHTQDAQVLRAGVRAARHIVSQRAFDPYRGSELSPGQATSADEAIDSWIKSAATSVWHGSGTCRMGSDSHSVVDPQLRVRGVDNLRIADASIMPNPVGGNTCTPTMMIGEKAAALMLNVQMDLAPRHLES